MRSRTSGSRTGYRRRRERKDVRKREGGRTKVYAAKDMHSERKEGGKDSVKEKRKGR